MLHDSRRDRFPTLMRFIAFCRSKPADERYEWWDSGKCACAQFFHTDGWHYENQAVAELEGANLNFLARGAGAWTFGALLERAAQKLEELANVG